MAEHVHRRIAGRATGAILVVGALAALQLAVDSGAVRRVLVPSPSDVLTTLGAILGHGKLWEPLAHTLYLLAIAYIASALLAIVLGLFMGRSNTVYNMFEPLLEVIRPLPKPALLPPLILFLGLGDPMKIVVASLAAFFPVLINTVQGVRGVDPVLVDTARTFGYGNAAIIRKIVLPASLPFIFAGLRISLGLGLIVVVVAEMLAGTGGIGYLILDMQRTFRVRDMYAWLVILACLGYGLNAIFVFIERRVVHWT
jgi:ABC-type nitrate/sulfonate/bicarbonate transport system permease component